MRGAGGGGLTERGTFFPWKGGTLDGGGLIEDLYTVEVWLAESSWNMSHLIDMYDSIFIAS